MGDGLAPIRTLVVQPTSFCNIQCSYCYVPGRNNREFMREEIIVGIASNVLQRDVLGEALDVIWHTGEPMTLPIAYYKSAFALLRRHAPSNTVIRHEFHTNATLVSPYWVDFFQEYGVKVGVSLDGPVETHDSCRRTRSGRGTHDATMRGIKLLCDRGLEPAVICVLTDASIQRIDELFWFFERHNLRQILFNVEEVIGANRKRRDRSEGPYFQRFLSEYLNLIVRHHSVQRIQNIDSMAAALFSRVPVPLCNSLVKPFVHVAVDVAGNYWTFSPELALSEDGQSFYLGNCLRDAIMDLRTLERMEELRAQINAGIALCREECSYFKVCGGGSPAHKFAEAGRFDITETAYCRDNIKSVADVMTHVVARKIDDNLFE